MIKMKFAITGTLSSMKRDDFEILLNKHGHTLNGVSKTTDYLIIAEKPGKSKISKSKEYGIETISEDEVMKMI